MAIQEDTSRALRRDTSVVWVGIALAIPGWLIIDYSQNYGTSGNIAYGAGLILVLTGLLFITVGFWFVVRSINALRDPNSSTPPTDRTSDNSSRI
jgi:hypothetical protein